MVKDNTVSSIILDVVIYIFLILLMIVTLYPIIYIFSVSLSSQAAFEAGKVVLWPVEPNLDAYKEIITGKTVPMSFLQAVINTVLYTVISLALTTTLAYPLSRSKDRVPFHGLITKLIVFTMFFTAGMIPVYLIVQMVGLLDTRWALILPVAISTYNLIVMRSFFESVPVELEEAAFIDGANELTIFVKIILPLSKAALATVGLFSFMFFDNFPTTQVIVALGFCKEFDLPFMNYFFKEFFRVFIYFIAIVGDSGTHTDRLNSTAHLFFVTEDVVSLASVP